MADDGFTPQVEWILRHCTGRTQTMLFSATLDGDVGHLIRHYLTDPIEVAVDSATGHRRHDAPPLPGRAPHGQGPGRRRDRPGDPQGPRVLPDQAPVRPGRQFARRPRRQRRGDPRRPPAGRPRAGDAALRRGQAAVARRHRRRRPRHRHRRHRRGIHYEPAKDAKDYLHRSGRTARAGRDGWAITFVEYNQHTQMRILQRGCGSAARRRSRCSATTSGCVTSTISAARASSTARWRSPSTDRGSHSTTCVRPARSTSQLKADARHNARRSSARRLGRNRPPLAGEPQLVPLSFACDEYRGVDRSPSSRLCDAVATSSRRARPGAASASTTCDVGASLTLC